MARLHETVPTQRLAPVNHTKSTATQSTLDSTCTHNTTSPRRCSQRTHLAGMRGIQYYHRECDLAPERERGREREREREYDEYEE